MLEIILAHPCSSVTESEDNPWRDSLRSEGSAEMLLDPALQKGLFHSVMAGPEPSKCSGYEGWLNFWHAQPLRKGVNSNCRKASVPKSLVVQFYLAGELWRSSWRDLLQHISLCVPIAIAHIWAWRQRWKSSLPHSYVVLQQALKHRGEIQLLKPSLVLPFGTPMFIWDISLEPAGMIMSDQTLLEQQ